VTVIVRETKETQVRVELTRGGGPAAADTGRPLLDHMMVTLCRYAGLGLTLGARGDLKHHLIEDVAIAFGEAIQALAQDPIARYGDRLVAMDDALVQVAVDLGGRPYYLGPLPSALYDHWMRSFSDHAGATLHLSVLRGHDRHHVVEAAFKALGLSLREALAPSDAVFSTKGAVKQEKR